MLEQYVIMMLQQLYIIDNASIIISPNLPYLKLAFAVKFKGGWVEVYPEGTTKPLPGTGLNKECDITLRLTGFPDHDQLRTVNIRIFFRNVRGVNLKYLTNCSLHQQKIVTESVINRTS